MADYTTIDNPGLFFNTVLYTGNGTAIGSGGNAITGVGFQPDWLWIKNRSSTLHHGVFDVVRGTPKRLLTSSTAAEDSNAETVDSFDADGFTVGSNSNVNGSGNNLVAWNWLGANGTTSNSDGSITSTVSANQTAGFSIATYTGNNSNAQTIGHGLGVAPKMYIIKRRDSTSAWGVYHASLGENKYLQLESTTSVATDTGIWNNTAPTSTVLSLGNAGYFNNASSGTYVCYAFAEKQGYSKFGKWTGNGQSSGPFIYTGFRPAFLSWKMSSSTENWYINDNKREPFNDDAMSVLYPNLTNSEGALNDEIDLLANGFKINGTNSAHNTDGATYIYWAIAEHPFVTAGTKAAGPAR
jgi:hypothetical protein